MTSTAARGPVDSSRIPRHAGPDTFARPPRTHEVPHTDIAVPAGARTAHAPTTPTARRIAGGRA
ncbi:agmatinase [Embleya hyalina]|uniref:Agmatinase n=1 Tax=Embleya hyalina TaxID=516124 RepID=A0A401YN77_9ACTN|nr:agmatinase [Embleya hyalina]